MKLEKIFSNKKYIRKIESMGVGLVLFEVAAIDKRIGQNYHLFYEDKRKPPLDIAINPNDGTIEYISYFVQDEMINRTDVTPKIINDDMRISIYHNGFNEDNVNIIINGRFKFLKMESAIWVLRDDIEVSVLNAYSIDDSNSLLFSCDEFMGIIFKNINDEEIQEIHNSKCL